MKTWLLARAGLPWAMAAALSFANDARSDDTKTTNAAVTGPTCVVKGNHPVPKDTQIFDARSGGKALAKFTGAFEPMQMRDFPADPANGRAKIATSTGSGSVRVEGYVAPSSFTFYSAKDIAVATGHVWISSGQKVALVGAASNSLTVELKIAGSNAQTVKAAATCDAVSLTKGATTAMDVPGNGRGYLTKGATTEVFDDPTGSAVFTLKMTEGTGQLFWSTEQKSGFVHVRSRGDVTIDGWVRSRDLEPLKKGEMMDQLAGTTTAVTGATLALDKTPPLAKATRDIVLRAKRDAKEPAIGAIETDAEVYLMETVAGWVNVLPKGLGIMPAEDMGFWIPAGEAPKAGP